MSIHLAGKSWRTLVLGCALGASSCSSSHSLGHSGDKVDEGRPGGEDEGDIEESSEPLTYYRDIKPILDQKCGSCHAEGGIGPMPFTSFDEVRPHIGLIKLDVSKDIMPPWRATGELDVFEGDRRLHPTQKKKLLRWIDQGAEEGNPDDEPEPLPRAQRGLARIDSTLTLPGAFEPNLDPDTYRCFVFEWPHEVTKFVTGLSVEPERAEMVHHAIVYLTGPAGAQAMRDRDSAEEGEGFECFSSFNLGTWLTSYEPGGYGQEFTGGVGMKVEPGSVVVLQIHYNTLKGKFTDQSRLDLTLEDEVERVGRTTLILNPLWVLPAPIGNMLIPANQEDVMHRWQGAPAGLGGAHDIWGVDLHMHTLGRSGSIGIVRAGSKEVETLLEIPAWAFEWQETYRFKEPVRLEQGDQLFVECHFNNTAEKQVMIDGKRLEPRDVRWGEGTTDEMCLGNVLTTPAQ
jgi:Copper type II ascorbate-dependent monooxygenase, C-terminal domain